MYRCDQFGERNNSWYCNPEVEKLLQEALVVTDQSIRASNYAKAAEMVMNDAAGIFIYNTKWYGPYQTSVKGIQFCPIGDGQEMRFAYIEK